MSISFDNGVAALCLPQSKYEDCSVYFQGPPTNQVNRLRMSLKGNTKLDIKRETS